MDGSYETSIRKCLMQHRSSFSIVSSIVSILNYHTAYLKGMSHTDLFFKNYYSYKLCLKSKKIEYHFFPKNIN